MLKKLPGLKIGMTQVFNERAHVVPVTIIGIAHWYVVQVKTQERDGYAALVVAQLKKKYQNERFNAAWLKDKQHFFAYIREVSFGADAEVANYSVGQQITLDNALFETGKCIDVTGTSIGRGFQGVVKRWNFSGGPKSHGSKFHRIPGSSGNTRSQGMVPKGKKFPGHCGNKRVTIKGLEVIRMDKENGYLFIKGSVPGKIGSLLMVGI